MSSKKSRSRKNSSFSDKSSSNSSNKSSEKKKKIKKRVSKVSFPLLFFISNSTYDDFISENPSFLENYKSSFKLDKISINEELKIPDLKGKVIQLCDESLERKCECLEAIGEKIMKLENNNKNVRLITLIPEGLVSLVIGSRGKQINTIMSQSKCEIVVNQPIYQMTYRTIKIDSTKISNVVQAFKMIHGVMEEKAEDVEDIEKIPHMIPIPKIKTSGKLVFSSDMIGFLIGKKGGFIKSLCDKFNVVIRFIDEPKLIQGSLQKVQHTMVYMLRRVEEYYHSQNKSFRENCIKVLIPNTHVTKLIGTKGCMVRDLASKSGGAQIKIMSSKQMEQEQQDCIITINGSLANKQDAACLILEQLEIFKNGGPVLLSGKSIHENSAGQYRNSLQMKSAMEKMQDREYRKYSDKYKKKKHGRSRSNSESYSKSRSRTKNAGYYSKKLSEYEKGQKDRRESSKSLKKSSKEKSHSNKDNYEKSIKMDLENFIEDKFIENDKMSDLIPFFIPENLLKENNSKELIKGLSCEIINDKNEVFFNKNC